MLRSCLAGEKHRTSNMEQIVGGITTILHDSVPAVFQPLRWRTILETLECAVVKRWHALLIYIVVGPAS